MQVRRRGGVRAARAAEMVETPLHQTTRSSEILLLVGRLQDISGISNKDILRLGDLHPTRAELEAATPW